MQRIEHKYKNVSPIFKDIETYFTLVSEKDVKRTKSLVTNTYDESFSMLDNIFYTFAHLNSGIKFENKKYKTIYVKDSDTIIVCFSGGKDSIATALYYKEQGWNVILYHMRHINPPLSDEYIHAKRLAQELDMQIYIDDIKLSGYHDYIEHPMKNMLIANGALNYGISNNITTKIAFGNYLYSSLADDNFDFCGGDCVEMWMAYENIIKRIIPDFEIYLCLENLNDTLEKVCYNKTILDMSVSCICRANLRDYWHNWAETKYNLKLPKHRCGRCYKCCVEYIYMVDHDLQEYNEDYYRYCLNNLEKNLKKEGCNEDVWNHYFFYDKGKSKYYG